MTHDLLRRVDSGRFPFGRRSRAVLATLLLAFALADVAGADEVDIAGFQVAIPKGFERGDAEREEEQTMAAPKVGAAPSAPRITEARAYRRTAVGIGSEKFVFYVLDGLDADADDPAYASGMSKGIVRSTGGKARIDSTTVRSLGANLRGLEIRFTIDVGASIHRFYAMSIPRRGSIGSISYAVQDVNEADADVRWKEILSGIRSTLGPSVLPSNTSPERVGFAIGQAVGYAAMLGLIGVIVARIIRYRRRARSA